MKTMRCAVTGSNGFLGRIVARHFAANGWEVLRLARRGGAEPFVPYDLAMRPEALPWEGVDALVHAAWDWRPRGWAEIARVNVAGSVALLRAARAAGVRAVFVSSLSAFDGCRSLYGRAKREVEAEALRLGCGVVRPGLVYAEGSDAGGITGAIERAAARLPLLPLIGDGSYPQYPIHAEDAAELLLRVCREGGPMPDSPLSAAPSEPVPFRRVLETFARRSGRRPRLIPVPWRLLWLGLRGAEAASLPLPFRSDSLLGLVHANPAPDFRLPPFCAMRFRPFR